ncbi:MAG: c-type cytochrome [Novosphingobium sp.]
MTHLDTGKASAGAVRRVLPFRLLGRIALAVALPLAPLSVVHGQAEDPVLRRQLIMQQVDEDAEALGMIAAGLEPKTKMLEHARSIAKSARESYEAFKQNAPGGRAKPEIWSNWADYSAKMEAWIANADKMVVAAEKGDANGVTEIMVEALPCKGCHDVYRERKTT